MNRDAEQKESIEMNKNTFRNIRSERDIWSVLSDNLTPDSYGGMYMKNANYILKL